MESQVWLNGMVKVVENADTQEGMLDKSPTVTEDFKERGQKAVQLLIMCTKGDMMDHVRNTEE